MPNRLKEIPAKSMEWWNKFTSKQKTIVVSVTAGIIVALVILIATLTRLQYDLLVECETSGETAEIKDLFEDGGINYKISDDGLQVFVLSSQKPNANLILGANNIVSESYNIKNVTDGGLSATESDKQKRYKEYLECTMETDLKAMEAILKVDVQLSLPEIDDTLISKEESFASVILELEGDLDQEHVSSMARFIATVLGNNTTNNVVIIDTEGNLLFSGEDNFSVSGSI